MPTPKEPAMKRPDLPALASEVAECWEEAGQRVAHLRPPLPPADARRRGAATEAAATDTDQDPWRRSVVAPRNPDAALYPAGDTELGL